LEDEHISILKKIFKKKATKPCVCASF